MVVTVDHMCQPQQVLMVVLAAVAVKVHQVALEIVLQLHHHKEIAVVQELHQEHHGQVVVEVEQVVMVLLVLQDLHLAEMVVQD